jgi:DNA-binding XRE family transcriptional regulator
MLKQMENRIVKTSEKVIIWMSRNNKTQIEMAAELGITRQTFAQRLKDNFFTIDEIVKLKRLGIE